MEEIVLSAKEFKALSSENRIKMLKILGEKNHTLTEISKKMNLSSPSAKQHLEVLMQSQLIEVQDEGRKWKYYSLTRKGKKILQAKETQTQVLILLSLASIAFITLIAMLYLPLFGSLSTAAQTGSSMTDFQASIQSPETPKNQQPQPATGSRIQEAASAGEEIYIYRPQKNQNNEATGDTNGRMQDQNGFDSNSQNKKDQNTQSTPAEQNSEFGLAQQPVPRQPQNTEKNLILLLALSAGIAIIVLSYYYYSVARIKA